MAGLNARQKRFVEEYLVDLNATQAAIRAGYSEKTAESQASRLLRNVKVAAAVEAGKAELSERTQVTQEWVVAKLRENVENGIQWCQGATVNGALNLLGKHLGMYTDRVDITSGDKPITQITIVGPSDDSD